MSGLTFNGQCPVSNGGRPCPVYGAIMDLRYGTGWICQDIFKGLNYSAFFEDYMMNIQMLFNQDDKKKAWCTGMTDPTQQADCKKRYDVFHIKLAELTQDQWVAKGCSKRLVPKDEWVWAEDDGSDDDTPFEGTKALGSLSIVTG